MSSPDSSSDGGPNPCPVLTLFPSPTGVFVPSSTLNRSYVGPVSRSHSRTSHSGLALAQLWFGRVPNLAPASTALILFVPAFALQWGSLPSQIYSFWMTLFHFVIWRLNKAGGNKSLIFLSVANAYQSVWLRSRCSNLGETCCILPCFFLPVFFLSLLPSPPFPPALSSIFSFCPFMAFRPVQLKSRNQLENSTLSLPAAHFFWCSGQCGSCCSPKDTS